MAGNSRGKLKEHFEGIHRNFDWVIFHVQKSLELIKDVHPKLRDGVESLGKATTELDNLAKGIYDKI